MCALRCICAVAVAVLVLFASSGIARSHEIYLSENKGVDPDVARAVLLPALLYVLSLENAKAAYLPSADDLSSAVEVLAAKGQSFGMGFSVVVEKSVNTGSKNVFYFVAGLDGNLHWIKEEWRIVSPDPGSSLLPGSDKLTLVKIWKFSLSGARYNSFIRNESGGMKDLREESLDVTAEAVISTSKSIWAVLVAEKGE